MPSKWIRLDASHDEVLPSTADMRRAFPRPVFISRYRCPYHRYKDETARQFRPKIQMTGKVRGRSRVTGNLSAESRPLAPQQHLHGSRLPAISRGELRSGIYPRGSTLASGREQKKRCYSCQTTCHGGTGAPINLPPTEQF